MLCATHSHHRCPRAQVLKWDRKKKKYVHEMVGGDAATDVFKMKKMRDSHGNLIDKKAGELCVCCGVFWGILADGYTLCFFVLRKFSDQMCFLASPLLSALRYFM